MNNMKKIFIVLAALAFCAQATTMSCARAYYNILLEMEFEFADDYAMDSSYIYEANAANSPFSQKNFWTGNLLDSVFYSDLDESRTIVAKNPIREVSSDGNLTVTTVKYDGEIKEIMKYYKTDDSTYFDDYSVWAGGEENEKEVGYIVLRNDTVYMEATLTHVKDSTTYSRTHALSFVQDDNGLCYAGTNTADSIRITLEMKGDTIHYSVALHSEEDSTQYDHADYFYIPVNLDGKSGIRRIRSFGSLMQPQYFDLKGRPVRNRHAIKVPKTIR